MSRAAWALAACVALAPAAARAQEGASLEALYPFGARHPESLSPMRMLVSPAPAFRGDVVGAVMNGWPLGRLTVRRAAQWSPAASRTVVLPLPMGMYDRVSASLEGTGVHAEATVPPLSGSPTTPPTSVLLFGLNRRVEAVLRGVAGDDRMQVGTVGDDPATGAAWLPPIPGLYGGAHVAVIGARALADATPESLRALTQWVELGGVAVISPRSETDLRLPWVAPFARAEDVARRPYGRVARAGLGAVALLDVDLHDADLADVGAAHDALVALAPDLLDAGGGIAPSGDLSLARKLWETRTLVSRRFRPRVDVRGALVPIAAALALYITAVGVALRRNRRSRAPLRVFVTLPLAGMTLLAAMFGVTWALRSTRTEARALAVYDMASGAATASERVFATLTAGRSESFAMTAPQGGFALVRTGSDTSSGMLRDEGTRVVVERARLGLWETGTLYRESPVPTGGGVVLSLDADRVPRVENRSPWSLERGTYYDVAQAALWTIPALAPGASARAEGSARGYTESSHRGLWPWKARDRDLAVLFVNHMIGPWSEPLGADTYLAPARLPAPVRADLAAAGFAVGEGAAVVRVLRVHPASSPEAAYPRTTLRVANASYGNDPEDVLSAAPVPMPELPVDAGDAGDAGDASDDGGDA